MAKLSTNEAVYDARQLGKGRMLVLGLQHMFAMFGATILVPTITGLSVSATLLFAGLGTLLFHWFTKMKVPAFLGSSFAFLGGYATVVAMGTEMGMTQAEALPYACVGVVAAGLLYFVLAAAFKLFGVHRVMKLFPPVVTGPIIISIGLILAGTAVKSILTNWWNSGVKTLDDIKAQDARHDKGKGSGNARSSQSKKSRTPSGSFYNFEQRNYDYQSLEAQLLNMDAMSGDGQE